MYKMMISNLINAFACYLLCIIEESNQNMVEDDSSSRRKLRRQCLNHSIYEWLTLFSTLFVPLVIGVLTVVLPLQQQNLSERQNENSKVIALNNRLQDMELLRDQQRQTVLNTFEHDLAELMLRYKLITSNFTMNATVEGDVREDGEESKTKQDDDDDEHDERISFILRTKTLHALRQLDPPRKILLIQLLIDSGVLHRINITRADLSSLVFPPGSYYNQLQFVEVIARNISLKRISLHQSNFSYSILDDSSFDHSNCTLADFSYASLQRTDWTGTDVTQAIFNYSNLLGAKMTRQQLASVKSLQGAILPDGSTAMG